MAGPNNLPPLPPGFQLDSAPSPFGSRPVIQEASPQPSAPSGYQFSAPGHLAPIPGGPADQSATGDKLSQEALDAETTNWLLTGKMSPFGMGNGPLRVQIQNNRPVVMHKYGITDNQLPAIQQQFSADAKAYSQRTQQLSFMKQAADAANQHVQQIAGYLKELPAQSDVTPINAASLAVQRAVSGRTVTDLDATIPLLQAEVAKVMTANPTGSSQLTDEARREFDILNSSRSPGARMEAMQALMEMVNRKISGTQSEADRLNQRINGGLASYAYSGASGGGMTPPGGGGGQPPVMPNDPVAPASGGTKEVVDPNLTPVRREYLARLDAGQSPQQLITFLRQAGVSDPKLLKTAVEQAQFRKKNPNVPVSQYDTSAIDHITQQMSPVNRAANAVGQTSVGAGAIAGGNAVLAGYGPEVVGSFGGNPEQARLNQQYSAQDHPDASLVGGIVGGTAAALGGEAALGRAGMSAGFGRSLLADSAYGAAAGSGASPDNRLSGAVVGGLAGAAGSVVGQGVAKGAASAFRGVTNKSVNAMLDAGVPLTMGQAAGQSGRVGSAIKGVEDRLTSVPGVGGMVNARRLEGVQAFNAKAFDTALQPIGGTVKGATGEQAMSNASQAVSDAFSAALKGKQAVPDQAFIQAARGPLERLASIKRNDLGPEIVQQIEESTRDLFDPKSGSLSGENMQSFLEALRQIKQAYKGDPLYPRTIKPALDGLSNAVTGMFTRQAPEVVPAFNAAKAAYRRVSILADAVDRAKDTEGTFTPAQLGMADRANAKKFDGKLASASGQSPFFDLQRAAQNVLPNKVPDSGTAGRLAMLAAPGALTGTGAGVGYLAGDTKGGAETGLGLTGILALAYTKAGQRRIASLLLSRNPQARALAEEITKRIPMAGAAGTALTQTSSGQ